MSQTSVKFLELATFNAADLIPVYQAMNTPGFRHALFFMRMVNASNSALIVSFDGMTDHEFIPINGVFELPSQTNSQPNAQVALMRAFTQVYIKGAPGVGFITLSGYYV